MEPTNYNWDELVQISRPTFQGEAKPPFGFATRMAATINAEKRIREIELLSWRAFICATFAVLFLLAFRLASDSWDDSEPGTSHLLSIDTADDL